MKRWLFLLSFFICTFCAAQVADMRVIQQQLPYIKDSLQYTDALNRLSILSYIKNADTCFYYANIAHEIAERKKYKKGIADALNNIGIYYSVKTNTNLATRYYNQSLDIYRELKDTANVCQLLNNIAIEFANNKRMEVCLRYFYDAYELSKVIRYDSIKSIIISNLLEFDTSIAGPRIRSLLQEAKAVAKKYNDIRVVVALAESEATELRKDGYLDSAIHLLKVTEKIAADRGIESELLAVDGLLGTFYFPLDDTTGIHYYKKALETARRNGYNDSYNNLIDTLYTIYRLKKDALNTAIYADILINSLKDNQRFAQESGINYMDYAFKEKESETFRNTSAARKKIIIALAALTVLGIIMLLFTYRSHLSNKKYSAALQVLNDNINRQHKQLEIKSEFKDKLVSVLAHDFRQPMASIKNLVMLLRDNRQFEPAELSRLLDSIESNSDTSIEIFENILQWIKTQLSGFVYEPKQLLLQGLVDDAARSLAYATAGKQLNIINTVPEGTIITADKEMLQFVHRNLIHNAIKFSAEHSSVTIAVSNTTEEIIVSVADVGKGISEEKIQSLFNFMHLKKYDNNNEKGAGVALVICKDFLERMNGRIWAESTEGKGTRFFYALPVTG